MSVPVIMALVGCGIVNGGRDSLTQAGHELEIGQTKSWSLGHGTRYSVDLSLDGEPLELTHWFHPLSPPPAHAPRTVYFGDGWNPDTWAYDTWRSFQIEASSPEQHAAAKAFLDAGTDDLFARLTALDAYRSSYARHQFVLFESEPTDQTFVAPSKDRFRVTRSGSVFFGRAMVGELEVGPRGVVAGITLHLQPKTYGSGPGAIRVQPTEIDPRQYRHQGTGLNVYTYYGIAPPAAPGRKP